MLTAEGAQAFFDAAVWFVSSGTLNRLVIGFAAIKALQIAAEFATIGKALWGLGAAGALGAVFGFGVNLKNLHRPNAENQA